jgi:hypothetical protein
VDRFYAFISWVIIQAFGNTGLREGVLPGGAWCWLAWLGRAFYALSVETLTFLFTDIEGSTALLRRLGEGVYAQVLADHHSLIRSGLTAHGGQEVDTQGDAFFAVFSSPKACVAAVVEMQRTLEAHRWAGGEQVRVRMGVHTGEAAKTAAGLVGLDVHRAARVAAVAYGGQVPAVGDGGCPGPRLAPARCGTQRSRSPPAEGPGTPGADLPAGRGGPAGRIPAAALARQSGAAEQSPGPAGDVHRPRPGAGRSAGAGPILPSGHPDRGRGVGQDQAEPAGGRRVAGWVRRWGLAG